MVKFCDNSDCAGVGCKHMNAKTHLSFDTTTICVKARRGTPCMYCYVDVARGSSFRAKSVIDKDTYDGWVSRLRPETVNRLKATGGIRMFAFGDYLRTHKVEIYKFLDDCQEARLPVKAITKVVQFVYDFHDHPALRLINVSVDNLSGTRRRSPVALRMAKKLKAKYDKVFIRAVILNNDDIQLYAEDPDIDVLTLNHGNNGYVVFSNKVKKELIKKYPGRVCCENVTCDGCKTLCGFANRLKENTGENKVLKRAGKAGKV